MAVPKADEPSYGTAFEVSAESVLNKFERDNLSWKNRGKHGEQNRIIRYTSDR